MTIVPFSSVKIPVDPWLQIAGGLIPAPPARLILCGAQEIFRIPRKSAGIVSRFSRRFAIDYIEGHEQGYRLARSARHCPRSSGQFRVRTNISAIALTWLTQNEHSANHD